MRIGLSIILGLLFIESFGQYRLPDPLATTESKPSVFFNFSTGVDNYTGIIGIGMRIPLKDQYNVRGGIGLGAWGRKLSVGINQENLQRSGWGIGAGFSFCPGVQGIDITFNDQSGTSKTVNMDLLPVGSFNLTVARRWKLKRERIFYLESGYALELGGNNLYKVNDGSMLTPTEEQVLQILRPGGIILALGFMFGI